MVFVYVLLLPCVVDGWRASGRVNVMCLFWDDCPIFAGGQISMLRDLILGKRSPRLPILDTRTGLNTRRLHTTPIYSVHMAIPYNEWTRVVEREGRVDISGLSGIWDG